MQTTTVSTDNQAEKPTKEPSKLTDKQLAYKLLREQGLSIGDAAKSLDYKTGYAYQLEHKIKKYQIKGNEKLLRKASRALNNLVEGRRFGELKEVKDSTVLAAVKEVYDRHEPVIKQSVNLNLNADVAPVDLSRYMADTQTTDRVTGDNPSDSVHESIDISTTYDDENK